MQFKVERSRPRVFIGSRFSFFVLRSAKRDLSAVLIDFRLKFRLGSSPLGPTRLGRVEVWFDGGIGGDPHPERHS